MIENTSQRDSMLHLLGAMSDGPSRYIEDMEADGQRQIVNSDRLPTQINRGGVADFEALGFVFGDADRSDPMFREATLPAGWKREGSDHSMWSYIIDEQGRRRVSIFYKAAFYDRSAHIGIQHSPTTKAQDDSYEAFEKWCPYDDGWKTDTYKDGDNLVRRGRLVRMENGRKVFDQDTREWAYTGRMRERVIAPDGSTVEERDA